MIEVSKILAKNEYVKLPSLRAAMRSEDDDRAPLGVRVFCIGSCVRGARGWEY
jgi:hypothetical protein